MTRIFGSFHCAALLLQHAHAQVANSPARPAAGDQEISMPPAASNFKFAVLRSTPNGLELISVRTVVEERTYVVQVIVNGVAVNEARTRSVNIPVFEQHDPGSFNAFHLNEIGGTEPIAALPNRTTPTVIAHDLKEINSFMKQLLRPGTIILIPKNDIAAPSPPEAP